MSKVVRLNENDIEKLVRKIISEEKSLNENKFFDWVRGKRFSDEETARNILQGIQAGEAKDVRPLGGERMMAAGTRGSLLNKRAGFEFFLADHKISAEDRLRVSPSYGARHDYFLFVDDVMLNVSENIVKKIIKELQTPTSKKMDLKTSLSRYSLPKEERQKMEDPGTYFPENYTRNKK